MQACGLRDNMDELKKAGVEVLGISTDKPEKLSKFVEKELLNFTIQHHVVVIRSLKAIKHFFDPALSIYQEADAMNAVIGFPHKRFFTPDAKRLADFMIFIGEQGKVLYPALR